MILAYGQLLLLDELLLLLNGVRADSDDLNTSGLESVLLGDGISELASLLGADVGTFTAKVNSNAWSKQEGTYQTPGRRR